MERKYPSILFVKERKDSEEIEITLAKEEFSLSKKHPHSTLPEQILPAGLSAKRQWYLYNHIRCHIPNERDKNETCPLPKISKSESEDSRKKLSP
ncbi:MAG: hypothetical protein GY801_44235 [bacterium]|nr:hypothetical protein [bacterium]